MSLPANHKIIPQSNKQKKIEELFKGRPSDGSVQIVPGQWYLPSAYKKYAEDIAKFQFENNDTLVMTVPKSGTTWVLEIIWTMRNNSNFDNPKAELALNVRTATIELDTWIDHIGCSSAVKETFNNLYPDFDQSHGMLLHFARMTPRPRTLKTHMPFPLLSPTILESAKVVYVIRDPRDVCISYHHHSTIFFYEKFQGSFDQYVEAFLEGAVWLGPYWPHVTEAWKRRDHPNLHIIFYEKLLKNTKEEIRKLDTFLGTNIQDEKLNKIVDYTSFDAMKQRKNHVVAHSNYHEAMNMDLVKKMGGFFRKGTSGGWRKVLTEEQKDKFEAWIKTNCPDQEIMNNILNP